MRLRDLKIGTRLNVILSIAFIAVFVAMGVYTLNILTNRVTENTDTRMMEQANDMAEFIEVEIRKNQKNVNRFLNVAHDIFYNDGTLMVQEDTSVVMQATNQISKATQRVELNRWMWGGEPVHNNYKIVDKIGNLTEATATIFQKIQGGYLRISTNVRKENGERAVGTFIPNSSPVIQTIEQGQTYKGRAFVVNAWYLTAYEPIYVDGQVKGILYVGVKEKNMGELKEVFNSKKYFETGYPYVVTEEGEVIIHPNDQTEGTSIADEGFFKEMLNDQDKQGKIEYEWEGKTKLQYFTYVEPIKSYVAATLYEEEFLGVINQARNGMIVAIIIGIGLFLAINTWISRSIANGLKRGVDFAKRVADGDLTTTIDMDQKDEVGEMANALNRMVVKLRGIVENVKGGSDYISSASQQVSSSSQQLSQGSSEQASSVEEVSSSMEEMASNIQQNTDNSNKTESIATSAAKEMEKMGEAGKKSLKSIEEIADKITIINDIAFQTNILALNAAVEAARAGEYGKGFAVVAAEVRKLAERSKTAADEIVELANSSVEVTKESDKLIDNLVPEIENVANLIREINAASQEQNSGATQVNNAIQQLNDVTQQNAASSEELATSAEELASQADQLDDTISFFSTGTEKKERKEKKQKTKTSHTKGNMQKPEKTTNKDSGQNEELKTYNKDTGVNINMNNSGNAKKDDEFESY